MNSTPYFVPIVHKSAFPLRHFVVVGRQASSTDKFTLDDLPTSGGRMDIIARCIRAAFLLSDDIRRNTCMDVVLLGGEQAPTTLRIDGGSVRFLRPDERRLAGHLRHVLGVDVRGESGFVHVAPGMQRARVGMVGALSESWSQPIYVLDKRGRDLRGLDLTGPCSLVLGDHTGLLDEEIEGLCAKGATKVSLGPVCIHAEDAIAVVHNEIDRQLAQGWPTKRKSVLASD